MKKLRLAHILVPIDFSPLSDGAIETALQLARPFAATIHLLHVREYHHLFEYMAPRESASVSVATFLDQASRRLAEDLKKLAHRYEISPAQCYIQEGAPIFNEIGKVARAMKADLIVMPTHGRTGLKHLFLGSTAERVAQHSPCPVFVLRKMVRKIDKLLVPVDFSDCALAGLQYAIQIAHQFAARIFVLHVAEVNDPYPADALAVYDFSALEESALRSGVRQMQAFARRAQFGSVKFETGVKVGLPVGEICSFAEKQKIDLIIAATHGRTGLPHVFMGSTAEQVMRHASRSVLIVPSHPEVRAKQVSRQGRPRALKKKLAPREVLTKKFRKSTAHPLPERRRTNKFRESHLG
jgi:nucleotide-binding universal stress UspA family protein